MKLYGFETFNVSKCLLTAEFAGVAYDYVAVDPRKGEHKTPEHFRRHPLGKVPALELADGRCLFESGAICRYLGRQGERPLYSGDAYTLGVIDEWMDFAGQHIGRWIAVFFFQEIVSHKLQGRPIDDAALAEAQGWLDQQLPVLERQLNESGYIATDTLTIADTYTVAYLQVHEVTSLDLSAYPAISGWYGRLRERAEYDRAMAHFPRAQLFQ